MTRIEFLTTLKLHGLKEKGGKVKIKDFSLSYSWLPFSDHAILKGKFPTSLVNALYERSKQYDLDITSSTFRHRHHHHDDDSINKEYRVEIKTNAALTFVIKTVIAHE